MTHQVLVRPVSGGWAVECTMTDQPMLFLSASAAEAKGRALARRLAGSGQQVDLRVHDLRDALVGRVLFDAA